MKDLTRAREESSKGREDGQELKYDDVSDINYAVMDRLGPDVIEQEG